MGLISSMKSLGLGKQESSKHTDQDLYITEPIRAEDCQNCSSKYPSNLKLDESPLFNSAPANAAQILVASGQHDWKHDIGDEKPSWGRVCHALSSGSDKLEKAAGGPVRVNGCDLAEDDIPAGQALVIVLPQFLEFRVTPENAVARVTEVLSLKPNEDGSAPKRPAYTDICYDKGFILLCSHKSRDRRCGVTAPIMRKELEIELRYADLYRSFDDDTPGGVRVLYVNHVGGHKFAANCFIYTKDGIALLLARVAPEHAKFLVEKSLGRAIAPEGHIRNCSRWATYEW